MESFLSKVSYSSDSPLLGILGAAVAEGSVVGFFPAALFAARSALRSKGEFTTQRREGRVGGSRDSPKAGSRTHLHL